jgi:hypothetical protein
VQCLLFGHGFGKLLKKIWAITGHSSDQSETLIDLRRRAKEGTRWPWIEAIKRTICLAGLGEYICMKCHKIAAINKY